MANAAGGFANILYGRCHAIVAGPGMERWSCGPDIPDASDPARVTIRDCRQDRFHLDGRWDGHWQRATDVLFERCRASACGWRSETGPAELYRSGFYVQSARLVDCSPELCRKVWFPCKNELGGGLVLENRRDTGARPAAS